LAAVSFILQSGYLFGRFFFGIGGGQEMTLEEIGLKFGLTRERVRQIKEKAIRRLSQESFCASLKPYLG